VGRQLDLTRSQILAFRRRIGALEERLPPGARSLRRAAWAGLQDSMPRAALLSIHARVEGATHATWEDPSLVQVWGPRFSAYVVADADAVIFTLGRWPDDPRRRHLGTAAPFLVVGQPAQREQREVALGDDVGVVARPPELDQRGIVPGRRLDAFDPCMEGEQRRPRHAVLQACPRRPL